MYPGYPSNFPDNKNQNQSGYGMQPIGFNVGQPNYQQGQGMYGAPQGAPYEGVGQPNPSPYGGQSNPSPFGGQPNPSPYGGQPPYNPSPYGGQPQHNPPLYGGQPQHNPSSYGGQQPPYGSAPYENQQPPYNPSPYGGQQPSYNPSPYGGQQPSHPSSGGQPGYPQMSGYPESYGPPQQKPHEGHNPSYNYSNQVASQAQHNYSSAPATTWQQGPSAMKTDMNIQLDCIGSGGEIYHGTIKPSPNFNAENDCNILRKAMKGLGTDEKAIIECLGRRCIAQRLEIKKTYKTMFGKDLLDELKSELSGDFRLAVIESLYDSDYYDVYSLRKAMEGAGTRENVLTEILTSRTNQQIENIKTLYKKWYNRDLEKDVISETSGFYKRVLVSCLQANKKELSSDEILRLKQSGPNGVINVNQARQEAQELYNAGEKKLGTDEACFIRIFALRNRYQLRATFDEYQKLAGRDIFSSIDREMSGDLESSLKAIAMQAVNSPLYFATRLHKAMKGAGTNDTSLRRVLLTRSEIDLANVKMEFQKQYGKSLESMVKSDTSGDYQRYLMRFVEGN